MAGPGDEIAAGKAGRGHLRASHADREQVIDTVKAAFVQGMLTKAELDVRLGQTFAARTCGELAALTADLPAGLAAAGPAPARPARRRPLAKAAAGSGGCLVIAAAAVRAIDLADPGPTPGVIPQVLGHIVRSHRPCRRGRGTWHPDDRGGRLTGAAALPPAAAASARTARPCPRRRTARRSRARPGSPRPPPWPEPRRPAGPQATTAPAAHSRPSRPGTPRH